MSSLSQLFSCPIALWLMPDRGIFPFAAIERTYPAYLILSVIWPVYNAVVLPGLPWLTPTRVALFVVSFFSYTVYRPRPRFEIT